jgi:hypothetical protein
MFDAISMKRRVWELGDRGCVLSSGRLRHCESWANSDSEFVVSFE